MAKAAHVTDRTIRQAKVAEKAGLGDAVRDGMFSVKRAAEIAKLPEGERAAAMDAPRPKPPSKIELRLAELEEENADLRERLAEMAADLKSTVEENESLVKAFEADDKLSEQVAENRKLRELNRVLEERIRGLQNERNVAIRAAKAARSAAERATRVH